MASVLVACAPFQGYLDPPDDQVKQIVPLEERPRVEPIARSYFVLESPEQTVVGNPQIVFTGEHDTFSDLAREYGLGYDELIAANPGIDPWVPGVNTPVFLPTQYVLPDVPHEGVVLNIASKRLFYFPAVAEGQPAIVMTYPIGIGRVGWETPLGDASVIAKARDPQWYVPASVRKEHADAGDPLPSVVPAGPDNPLGRYVLKLDLPGYLIHGTNQPYGVGMRVSHGCVRLYPENIELLYSLVEIGESVSIINKPYLVGRLDGELYFEAHEPLEDDTVSPEAHLEQLFEASRMSTGAFSEEEEQNLVRSVASEANGVAVRVLLGDDAEVFERALVVRNTFEPDPEAPSLAEAREFLFGPAEESNADESAEETVVVDNDATE